jgi:hypothetical protein
LPEKDSQADPEEAAHFRRRPERAKKEW